MASSSSSRNSASSSRLPRESAEPAIPGQASGTSQPDLATLRLQLRRHKERMFEQGLLNNYFKQLELLELTRNHGFVAEIIQDYFSDVESIFSTLENLL